MMLKVNYREATVQGLVSPGTNNYSLLYTCLNHPADDAQLTPLDITPMRALVHSCKYQDHTEDADNHIFFNCSFLPEVEDENYRFGSAEIIQKQLRGDYLQLHHLLFTMLALNFVFESYNLTDILNELFSSLSEFDLMSDEGIDQLFTEEHF